MVMGISATINLLMDQIYENRPLRSKALIVFGSISVGTAIYRGVVNENNRYSFANITLMVLGILSMRVAVDEIYRRDLCVEKEHHEDAFLPGRICSRPNKPVIDPVDYED